MRLLRHLTFSNAIALIALFVALGGAAYAGSKLNGENIVNASIGGGKLKNETITANKIKKGTITGDQIAANSISSSSINLTTLGTVPAATTAQTATTATTAQTATNATNATKAESATTAGTATNAENAKHAEEADDAKHAAEADNATHAREAESLEGTTAEELTLSCDPTITVLYGGMCWDNTTRPIDFWISAVKTCGNAGGRLPLIGELIAFVSQTGTQVTGQTWSADLISVSGSEKILTSDDNENVAESGGSKLGFRCVYPLTN
jgi:hypothetical protein